MKTLIPAAIRCSLMFTAVAALSLAYPTSVQAVPTTYHYTGNPFTEVEAPYTTDMFVTAMVTLAAPLGANMPLTEVTPTAFTLFDGVQTISSTNPNIVADDLLFRFATNARGEITFWDIRVDTLTDALFQEIATRNSGFMHPGDVGSFNILGSPGPFGESGVPGVWTQANATPDAGSTLSLMTLTLMALGLVARRFQRAAG